MNLRLDLRILGILVASLGVFHVVPLVAALVFGEAPWPWLGSGGAAVAVGLAAMLLARPRSRILRPRDAYLVGAAGGGLASLVGAAPYLAHGALGPVDALFESVSGFTTTGSTVLTGLDRAPRGLLLWRSLSQWVGGMGIILFAVAVLPLLGIGGMQLFRVEVPGPVKDKLRPRVIETARRLWAVYVGLTAVQWLALRAAGMSAFEALCHSFTTLATGGFSTRDASIGGFASPAVEWIVIVFMILAGVNFVLLWRVVAEGLRPAWRDAELRYYLAMLAIATLVVAPTLPVDHAADAEATVRNALFGVVAIATTTGYGTVDFELWPALGQLVVLLLMVLGGMAGSTAGGVKSLRVLIGFRALAVAVERLVHPRAVRPVKHAGRSVPDDVVAGVWAFFTAYFTIAALTAAVVTGAGYDVLTGVSSALTALGNVGPGLGAVGPYDNFAHFPATVKLALAGCMLAGRLEIFTIVLLFLPSFWRR
ncbi:MAG TPA: potassium transporter TrkG [Myxococcota bacterium]|nr:potassium transporter TrkG [Myxococcota bacterium]